MKTKENRQQQLLAFLRTQTDFVAAKKIATELDVTNKVIYSDIDELNEQLNPAIRIEKVPRKGIILKESSIEKPTGQNNVTPFERSVAHRRLQIMKRLLIEQKSITYSELATLFNVGQASIQNDLAIVEEVLLGQHIHFISGSFGTRIIGNEADIQAAIFSLIEQVLTDDTCTFTSKEPYIDVLTVVYDTELVTKAQATIQTLIQMNRRIVEASAQQALVILWTIFLDRIQRNKHMTPDESFFKKLNRMELYLKAQSFLEELQVERPLVFIPNDIEYVSSIMARYGIDYGMGEFVLTEELENSVHAFIAHICTQSHLPLLDDPLLVESLHWFVPQMVERVKQQQLLANPLSHTIKEEYASSFRLVQEASNTFHALVEHELPEDEVAFLTLFIQAAIERMVQPRNILLVSPLGLASSEALYERVHQVINQNDRLELANLQQLYQKDIENVDYIISSVVLDKSIAKPVIYVSAVVTDEEVQTIAQTLALHERSKPKVEESLNHSDKQIQPQDEANENENCPTSTNPQETVSSVSEDDLLAIDSTTEQTTSNEPSKNKNALD